ncbi:Phosphoserine phosphatase RsbP [Phycisphaerae bacterium RAS1]|nr:Phosphoserine phosphatase RsbP [Phycisphaerae bacterium RAS1]
MNTTAPPPALEFVCSEIWGGNRPVDRAVELPGVVGRLFSKPCGGGRGGDVHYMSVCGSGLLSRTCIADVAGHGEAVAAVSHELHGLLRRYMNNLDQRRVLADLNRTLEQGETLQLATAAAFTYYPPARSLSFSYAGHPPAWVFRRSSGRWGRLSLDAADGLANMPLAVSSDTHFTRGRTRVDFGDRLLIVTDGVLEAPAPGDATLYGDERLTAFLNDHRDDGVDDVSRRLVQELIEYTGDATLRHDDVTFALLEFRRGPRGPAIWTALKNRLWPRRGNTAE